MKKLRVLFVLKSRDDAWGDDSYSCSLLSSGLLNSANFVHKMLVHEGVDSRLVNVIDNNSIDREVSMFKPSHVIIEAYWVVPAKLAILKRLHPNVKWIVRNHSEVGFLSSEGMALGWTIDYTRMGVEVACNSPRTTNDLKVVAHPNEKYITYLPNYYPHSDFVKPKVWNRKDILNVGCFGAIRILKNQLIQGIAAIEAARNLDMLLRFHINAHRIEMNSQPVLKNLREMFAKVPHAELVEHKWKDHQNFIHTIRGMDVGMQVSFNESFNIVMADFVSQAVPVVASEEVPWLSPRSIASTTDRDEMTCKLLEVLMRNPSCENQERLISYSENSKRVWLKHLTK